MNTKKCRCGHDRTHHMVSAENHYDSIWRYLVLALGVSVEPVRVTFHCRACGEVFDETRDPKVMRSSC
jgi:hypothetical protein